MINQSTPTINHFSALINFPDFQDSIKELEKFADSIVKKLNLNTVSKITHSFEPMGKTLVYILSESHLALHT